MTNNIATNAKAANSAGKYSHVMHRSVEPHTDN